MSGLRHQIQVRRKRADFSISELARRTGIAKATLVNYFNGKQKSLTTDQLSGIARTLDCTAAELMGETLPPAKADADANAVRLIPLDDLAPSRINDIIRSTPPDINDLARSIAHRGILQNLVVRANTTGDPRPYEIIAGHRRYFAARQALAAGKLPKAFAAPCRVVEADDTEHLILALVENLQRVDPAPLEEAAAYDALCRHGMATAEIAKRIKVSQRHVQLRLALVRKLDIKAQSALMVGAISLAHARVLTGLEPGDQKQYLGRIHKGELARPEDLEAAIHRHAQAAAEASAQEPLFTNTDSPPAGANEPARPGAALPCLKTAAPAPTDTAPPGSEAEHPGAGVTSDPTPAPEPKKPWTPQNRDPRPVTSTYEPEAVLLKQRIVGLFGPVAMPEKIVLFDPASKLMATFNRDPREDATLGRPL